MRFALAALVVAATAGCASAGAEPRLTVFAAASLTDVLPRIDDRPRYSFAGSDELAVQIREGAPADVYATASKSHAAALRDEGVVRAPRVFATNRLVLIVPEPNRAGIRSVHDLERKPAKLVIGAEGVPVGDYARAALDRLGAEDALARVVSEEEDVKGVASKVALGEADAGFVYATDVASVAARVAVIEVPRRAQPPIEYVIAVVARSEHAAAAEAFVAEVLGPRGRRALRAAGFGLP
ncbi:MAG TPA: molybdate ABC transporter substrate-binding protein [Gaiellaceae bacterium]|nr:molybdate ABC transporter substrate-binding protein [Gaiellaceae bacterium]